MLSYGCSDTVVIGSVRNESHEHVKIEDDLLGHGWTNGKIHVRRVIIGSDVTNVLPLRYFTHANLREDKDFLFVLQKRENGVYGIGEARLMDAIPKLARRCGQADAEGTSPV